MHSLEDEIEVGDILLEKDTSDKYRHLYLYSSISTTLSFYLRK